MKNKKKINFIRRYYLNQCELVVSTDVVEPTAQMDAAAVEKAAERNAAAAVQKAAESGPHCHDGTHFPRHSAE